MSTNSVDFTFPAHYLLALRSLRKVNLWTLQGNHVGSQINSSSTMENTSIGGIPSNARRYNQQPAVKQLSFLIPFAFGTIFSPLFSARLINT